MGSGNALQLPWSYWVYDCLAVVAAIPPLFMGTICLMNSDCSNSYSCGNILYKALAAGGILIMTIATIQVLFLTHRLRRGSFPSVTFWSILRLPPGSAPLRVHKQLISTIGFLEFFELLLTGGPLSSQLPFPFIFLAGLLLIVGLVFTFVYYVKAHNQ